MTTHINNLTITTQRNGKATISVYCMNCDERFTKRGVALDDLMEVARPHNRRLIQDIFPKWSTADRELFFMSNICAKCFKRMIGWDVA